jgi:hypothetical protein
VSDKPDIQCCPIISTFLLYIMKISVEEQQEKEKRQKAHTKRQKKVESG